MWNGRWSRELDALCGMYYDIFGSEPDCDTTVDFDTVSYQQFMDAVRKSVITRAQITL